MAAQLTTLFNFASVNGEHAVALIADANGDVFGTTNFANAGGRVIEFQNIGTIAAPVYASAPTTLATFSTSSNESPSQLIIDANGDLLGPTFSQVVSGGTVVPSGGTMFEIQNIGSVAAPVYASAPTTLATFNSPSTPGSFIADANGNLFGTVVDGGVVSDGVSTVIEFQNTGTRAAPVYATAPTTFSSISSLGLLSFDANNDLFGTEPGGVNNDGTTVVEFQNIGTVAAPVYASAPTTLVTVNGFYGLTFDAKGDLFGASDPANGDGTVIEFQNTGTVAAPVYASAPTTLVTFNGPNGNPNPAALTVDAKGDLFGTSFKGGANGDGSVFEIQNIGTVAAPVYASTPITLATFNGSNGQDAQEGLTFDAKGDLFGTTFEGGANGDGTVFEITNSGFVPFTPVVSPDFTHVTFGQQDIVSAPGALKNDQPAITGDTLTVSAVSVNGASTPVSGSVGTTVTGHYGSLQMFADGHYDYTASGASALPRTGVSEDFFGCTTFDQGQYGSGSASSALTVVVTAPGLNVIGAGQSGVTIQGPNGHKPVLDGSAGNDTLIAGTGATVLIGGSNDTLTAHKGYVDTCVFMGDFGSDKITNYNSVKDVIQSDASQFTSIADVHSHASQVGADTVIQDGGHGSVTLVGVQLSSLHFDASHFLLA
jgi:uncharacterized repeat protein (TIGR03803 family)